MQIRIIKITFNLTTSNLHKFPCTEGLTLPMQWWQICRLIPVSQYYIVWQLNILKLRQNGHHFADDPHIVNWTLRNKRQWNCNQNLNIFIQENALEYVVCEMASILSQPQCVNIRLRHSWDLPTVWYTGVYLLWKKCYTMPESHGWLLVSEMLFKRKIDYIINLLR